MLVGGGAGGGGGGLGFDYSSSGFGFEAPWVPPPYDPYISFGLFPGSWQSYLKATGMWETFLFNQFHSFFFSHLTFGSGEMEIEEGVGALTFGKGDKEIEYGILLTEMTGNQRYDVMRALTLMSMYGGSEGWMAAVTICENAVLWQYKSGVTFGPGMTSKNWKDVAIDFDDLSPLKVGWKGKVRSVTGALVYIFAHESWHVQNRKGDPWLAILKSSVHYGPAANYGWGVYLTVSRNMEGLWIGPPRPW